MKRKINSRLIQTAALAIIATLLLTVAVCYNLLQEQILDDLKSYAGIVKYMVMQGQDSFFEKEIEGVEIIYAEDFDQNYIDIK